jgi:hypothetical protein
MEVLLALKKIALSLSEHSLRMAFLQAYCSASVKLTKASVSDELEDVRWRWSGCGGRGGVAAAGGRGSDTGVYAVHARPQGQTHEDGDAHPRTVTLS